MLVTVAHTASMAVCYWDFSGVLNGPFSSCIHTNPQSAGFCKLGNKVFVIVTVLNLYVVIIAGSLRHMYFYTRK